MTRSNSVKGIACLKIPQEMLTPESLFNTGVNLPEFFLQLNQISSNT